VTSSWQQLFEPHARAPEQPRIRVNVTYGDATGVFEPFAKGFRALRLLETVAETTSDLTAWPKPFTLEMKICDYINAAWVAETRTLTLCYELAKDFSDLYREFNLSPRKEHATGHLKRQPSRDNFKLPRRRSAGG
jgi:Putative metallopeptidase